MAQIRDIIVTTRIRNRQAKRLEAWARRHAMSLDEAAERLIQVGIGRLAALAKYNKKLKKEGSEAHH